MPYLYGIKATMQIYKANSYCFIKTKKIKSKKSKNIFGEICLNILLLADFWLGWTGGTNLLACLARTLQVACKATGNELVLAIGRQFLENPNICEEGYIALPPERVKREGSFDTLLAGCNNLEKIYFVKDLGRLIVEKEIDIIGPTGNMLVLDHCPWLGYIADFQHQYYPQFFSNQEREIRDIHFRRVVQQSYAVYVNSPSVSADLEKYFPGFFPPKKIFQFPTFFSNLTVDPAASKDLPRKYGITSRYFISCSQRWIHKQHDIVIEAFRLFCENNPQLDYELVFTGATSDYRNDDYNNIIKDQIARSGVAHRIKSLGLIDRQDQIHLINESQGLIQASLFEGGAGASGMQEAASLSKPIVASDIKPNREFNQGRILYFSTGSSAQLANSLLKLASTATNDPKTISTMYNTVLDARDLTSGFQLLQEFEHTIYSFKENRA
jgi:glycosyltransferase involved in cell wall biosynthesis